MYSKFNLDEITFVNKLVSDLADYFKESNFTTSKIEPFGCTDHRGIKFRLVNSPMVYSGVFDHIIKSIETLKTVSFHRFNRGNNPNGCLTIRSQGIEVRLDKTLLNDEVHYHLDYLLGY